MGQISFSAFDDKFHQRTQVIKLLDQDYTYLDYFQVKFFQIYSYTSGNRFMRTISRFNALIYDLRIVNI